MRTSRVRLIAPILAMAMSACGASQAVAPARFATPQPTPSPVSSLAATPAPPHVTVVDAAYVVAELSGVEQGIRLPDTPAQEYLSLGRRQQSAYHLLASHPDWIPAVLSAVPASVRSAVQANISAAQQIDSLNGASTALPHWRIIAPPAPDVLLGYYREAQQTYGIQWPYLAAINLIETNMGRDPSVDVV